MCGGDDEVGRDVIVVDVGGDLTNALIGEIVVAEAIAAGVAGYVIDGAIRDAGEIRRGALPVYAAGVTDPGHTRTAPARSTCRSRSTAC